MVDELKPCPFCDERLTFSEAFGWEHGGESRRCIADNIVLQDEDDIDAWNTRQALNQSNGRKG